MSRTLEFVGRGLLMLALGSYAMGCGDDDDNTGADSGVSGTGGTGSGGMSGGSGGSKADGGPTGSGGATADGGTSACLDAVDKATSGMIEMACAACVCEHGPMEATACTTGCWTLVRCYAENCADVDPSDSANAMSCALDNCTSSLSMPGYMGATPLGKVITASCSDVCTVTPAGAGDGGTDDGGT